jgi:hypothetical protein
MDSNTLSTSNMEGVLHKEVPAISLISREGISNRVIHGRILGHNGLHFALAALCTYFGQPDSSKSEF